MRQSAEKWDPGAATPQAQKNAPNTVGAKFLQGEILVSGGGLPTAGDETAPGLPLSSAHRRPAGAESWGL